MSEGYEMYEQGRAAMKEGRIEDAIRLLQRSVALDPHFKAFELIGECLMKLDRHADAVGPLAAAVALNRGVRAPSLLAESFHSIGRMAEAREFAELALQRDPTNRKAKGILNRTEANQAVHATSGPAAGPSSHKG
ncbi:MAG: hypothetical protein C0404_07135 [Verrucomicrobia bacterium]|nr:hypothetical protein [Verrucomicrobiota bacterium]